MQRQSFYTFSFLEYTGDGDKRERVTRAVAVTMETTRKGKVVFKTRLSWDDEARTYLTEKDMEEVPENPDRMDSCHYFWDCMHYAVALCLLEEVLVDALPLSPCVVLPLPKYGQKFDYFDHLAKELPGIRLKKVDNGW